MLKGFPGPLLRGSLPGPLSLLTEERVHGGLTVSELKVVESILIMAASVTADRQARCWSSS